MNSCKNGSFYISAYVSIMRIGVRVGGCVCDSIQTQICLHPKSSMCLCVRVCVHECRAQILNVGHKVMYDSSLFHLGSGVEIHFLFIAFFCSLRDCDLQDDGTKYVAEALKSNTTCKSIT